MKQKTYTLEELQALNAAAVKRNIELKKKIADKEAEAAKLEEQIDAAILAGDDEKLNSLLLARGNISFAIDSFRKLVEGDSGHRGYTAADIVAAWDKYRTDNTNRLHKAVADFQRHKRELLDEYTALCRIRNSIVKVADDFACCWPSRDILHAIQEPEELPRFVREFFEDVQNGADNFYLLSVLGDASHATEEI